MIGKQAEKIITHLNFVSTAIIWKKTWSLLRTLIGSRMSQGTNVTSLVINETKITVPQVIDNKFKKIYNFRGIAQSLAEKSWIHPLPLRS